MGYAASTAEGTGCAGGAIGGAASAALSPDFIKAMDPTGAPLSAGQQAALAGFATLLGGMAAGLAGQDAQAGAMAAQNEAPNNSGDHPEDAAKKGGLLSQFGSFVSAAGSHRLGRIWVGEGARPMKDLAGALVSADGSRTYRPPAANDSRFAFTGVQANFQQFKDGQIISNGHLNITP